MVLSQIEGVNSDYFIVLCLCELNTRAIKKAPTSCRGFLIFGFLPPTPVNDHTLCILLFLEDILSFYEAKNNAKKLSWIFANCGNGCRFWLTKLNLSISCFNNL